MADKELRRMNRTELIEIIYALQQNEQELRNENEELKKQLSEREIILEKSGSIAEASMELNHVFEAAQQAADQYILSVREKEKEADGIIEEAQKQAEEIRSAARSETATQLKAILRRYPMLAEYLKKSNQ